MPSSTSDDNKSTPIEKKPKRRKGRFWEATWATILAVRELDNIVMQEAVITITIISANHSFIHGEVDWSKWSK